MEWLVDVYMQLRRLLNPTSNPYSPAAQPPGGSWWTSCSAWWTCTVARPPENRTLSLTAQPAPPPGGSWWTRWSAWWTCTCSSPACRRRPTPRRRCRSRRRYAASSSTSTRRAAAPLTSALHWQAAAPCRAMPRPDVLRRRAVSAPLDLGLSLMARSGRRSVLCRCHSKPCLRVRVRRAQVPIVSLQVPVDTSCEYAGLPYIDHFGETIAFVGGINKPKLVQCFDRRACAPVDLAGQHQAVLRPRCHAFTWHQAPVRHKSISALDTEKSNETSTTILWLGSAKAVSLLAL